MTSAQVVETSATNNSSFQNYTHPYNHTIPTSYAACFGSCFNTSLVSARVLSLNTKWPASYSWFLNDCRQRRSVNIILSQLCASFSIFLHSLTHDSSVPLAFDTPVVLRQCWAWHSSLFFCSSWIHVAQEQQTTNKGYRPTNHNHFVLHMKKI